MCVYDVSEIEVLEEDLVAYKAVVRSNCLKNKYFSRFNPLARRAQVALVERGDGQEFYPRLFGKTVKYRVGKKTKEFFKDSPGLYCYSSIRSAVTSGTVTGLGMSLLKVLIPSGTKVRYAKTFVDSKERETILTEVVIPIEEVKDL